MIRLRIAPDGTVRSLWTDEIDWPALGRSSVRRASHVEFCDDKQLWYIRAGKPRSRLGRILQLVLRRPFGEILHWARSRTEALAWEREHYEPGAAGWPLD
ncbi:MAG TPA: hypothetical protein VM243_10755 [Phycisphaerae bacterium]|nr:hypothetical protein [Phycisphaerae bacterium]